ncbi:mediator of DNA damage checkpoint protein 1-like isoform X2 [Limulus polyphemus]|uniref:Mediator of DNA damage checkpoint protein 1-like isoform X2 n=2 Tax=Limulus polyphemus TaxID=6850 RepID=A0ABM1T9K2_LIMPO|nr:mediator of DNA damage checkpoint protein 1-like isoform X2 [Limulus polyphemus]
MAAIAPFVLGVAAFFFYIFFKFVLKKNETEAEIPTDKQEKSHVDATQSEETGSEKQTLEDYGKEKEVDKVADALRTAMSELSTKSVKEKPKEEVQVEEVKDTMSQTVKEAVKEQDMNKDVCTAPTESEPKQEEIKKSEEISDTAKTSEVITEKPKIVSTTPVESCEIPVVEEAIGTDSKKPTKEVASQEAVASNVPEIPVSQVISETVSDKEADQVCPAESLTSVPISETKPEPPTEEKVPVSPDSGKTSTTKEITEVLEKLPEKEVPSFQETDKVPTAEVLIKCPVTDKTSGELEQVLSEKVASVTEPGQILMDQNIATAGPSEKTSDEVSKIPGDEGVRLKESNQTLTTEQITELPASVKIPEEVHQEPTEKSSVPTEEHSQPSSDTADLIPTSQKSHENVPCTEESSSAKATDLPVSKTTTDDITVRSEEVPVSKVIVEESDQTVTADLNASEQVQKDLVSDKQTSVPPTVEEVKPQTEVQTVGLEKETLSKDAISVKGTDTQLSCSDGTTEKSIDSSSKEASEPAVTQEPKKELQEPKRSNEGSSPDLGSFIVTDSQPSTTPDTSVIIQEKTPVETCQESTDKQTEAVEKTGDTEKKSTSSKEGDTAGNEKVEQLSSKAEKVLSMDIQQPDDESIKQGKSDVNEGKAVEIPEKECTLQENTQQKIQEMEGKDEEVKKSEVMQMTKEEVLPPENKIEEKQCGKLETSEL